MTGETISSYRIVEKLGEGGMGVVYKAWDLRLDRPVALKFIAADLLPSADAQARFRHEARALAWLNHPNIAGIYGVDGVCGRLFLVLEYLPGRTLRQFVKAVAAGHSKISPATVRAFALQVAEGLAHAHRHGIYHRDVKTDNAMLAAEGAVKVTDFGLAKIRGGMELTAGGRRLGTPAYMSPEQIEGRPVDQRSDIFSFGVLLYELASGERPFRGDSEEELVQAILHQPHRPLRETRSDLPPGIETVVNRALEKRPAQRWASMDEVVAELSGSGRFLAAGKTTATFGGALQRPRSRRKWFAFALCLLVVALAAAGAWIWRSGGTGVEKGASVLLADIENQTGDAQLDAVTEILRAQVAQSVHFNLLGRAEVRRLIKHRHLPCGRERPPQPPRAHGAQSRPTSGRRDRA